MIPLDLIDVAKLGDYLDTHLHRSVTERILVDYYLTAGEERRAELLALAESGQPEGETPRAKPIAKPRTTRATATAGDCSRVYDYLRIHGATQTATQIATATVLTAPVVSAALAKLTKAGEVFATGRFKSKSYGVARRTDTIATNGHAEATP